MNITQIVPRFWPQFDGLGDYARLLGEHIEADFGIASRFVVGDPHWIDSVPEIAERAGMEVLAVEQQTSFSLLSVLAEVETVVLHYVGYGYHSRGIPFWINEAIRKWRSGSSERRLIVVFHELWASGPPWKSECYLGWIQRRLVRELYELADISVASVPLALRRLNAFRPKNTILHPVPCNIGSTGGRNRQWHSGGSVRLALFGMPSQREISLRNHLKLVAALRLAGLLHSVKVIGKDARGGENPSNDVRMLREIVSDERIEVISNATPERAGHALAESDLLLSFYPSRWLFKSGSAMAALANGVVPILPEGRDLEILAEGREVFVCSGDERSIAIILERVRRPGGIAREAKAGYNWYWAHADWPILTAKLAAALQSMVSLNPDRFGEKISSR